MNTGMLSNYLLTAWRFLRKNPLYSGINILGLGAGLACCILIFLFVRDELSYDRWLPDAERIYRAESTFNIPGRAPLMTAHAPGPLKPALEKDFPDQIEHVIRLHELQPTISLDDRQFNDTLLEVDPEFFDVFQLPFVEGDPATALNDNASIVLTQSMARKYFGDEPALGRTLTLTRREPATYRVTGVIRDLPPNSHMELSLLSRFDPAYYAEQPWVTQRWTSVNVYMYVEFKSADAARRVASQMSAFTDRNVDFGIPEIENMRPSDLLDIRMQPVQRIHLYSTMRGGFKPGGDITTVYTFSAVAILILLIASINFMNLATARSLQRAREVSMRKVVGATRGQLIVQFLGESVLMTILALVFAAAVVWALLPWYNEYIGKSLGFNPVTDWRMFLTMAGLTAFVGILGGLYPAFFLSRFKPANVLKANQSASNSGSPAVRTALVVLQFSISIGLIVVTLVIYSQTWYAKHMSLGYTRDHEVFLSGIGREKPRPHQESLLREIARLPGVVATGRASDTIPQQDNNNTLIELPEAPTQDLLVFETLQVDGGFLQSLDIKPRAGRLFSEDFPADALPPHADKLEGDIRAGEILNVSGVKALGYSDPKQAIGKTFRIGVGEKKKAEITVVGVIDDLHMRSVHFRISPTLYLYGDDPEDFYAQVIHVRADNLADTLAAIDRVWSSMIPEVPIERTFLDEEFAKQYRSEEERMKVFGGFAAFAVFVACLGLFGLAAFSADRRTREIGIRKVLGASTRDIQKLMLWQFSRPVVLANLLAWPAAWYFLRGWLNGFEYRVHLTPVPFVEAGVAALAIAWITVYAHAARVSRANPVRALRYE